MAAPLVDRPTTPWGAGRFDGRPGPARLLFGRTFEDPAIEAGLFPVGGTVLCIASAGDTARALAAGGRSVVAVDINPAQIAEVRRRLAGHPPRAGAADRLLAVGRGALSPAGWWPSRLERFCALDDPAAQVEAWRRLTPPSVRVAARVALSPPVLRLAYGEAFARLVPAGFGPRLLDRIGARTAVAPNRANPWLRHLLTGAWTAPDPVAAPGRIELRCADVAAVLEGVSPGSLDGISLSNVLDGPGPAYVARLLAAARRASRPGAAIVVRSFLEPDDDDARRLAADDRSLLWGGIAVHRA
jgi:hypothetical protein